MRRIVWTLGALLALVVLECQSEWKTVSKYLSFSPNGVNVTWIQAMNICSLESFNDSTNDSWTNHNGTFWLIGHSNTTNGTTHRLCPVIVLTESGIDEEELSCNSTVGYVCQGHVNVHQRHVNVTWSTWSTWSSCSDFCPSNQNRTRNMTNYVGNWTEHMIHYRSCDCSDNSNTTTAATSTEKVRTEAPTPIPLLSTLSETTASQFTTREASLSTTYSQSTSTTLIWSTTKPTDGVWSLHLGSFFIGFSLFSIALVAACTIYYYSRRRLKDVLEELDYMKTVRCTTEAVPNSENLDEVENMNHYQNADVVSSDKTVKAHYENVGFSKSSDHLPVKSEENNADYIIPEPLPSSSTQYDGYEPMAATGAAKARDDNDRAYENIVPGAKKQKSLRCVIANTAFALKGKGALKPVEIIQTQSGGSESATPVRMKALKPVIKQQDPEGAESQKQDAKKTNTSSLQSRLPKNPETKSPDASNATRNNIIKSKTAIMPMKKY